MMSPSEAKSAGYTIIPLKVWAVVILAAFAALFSTPVNAQAFAEATADGARVVLYREPCRLPAVKNLPFRAEWIEGKSKHEGCWGADQTQAVLYFDDLTVVAIPRQAFRPLVQS